MEEKKLKGTLTFFKSFTSNRVLFERRNNSIWFPIIILIILICLLALPSYIFSSTKSNESLMKNFPSIEAPMTKILTSDMDCSVKNETFSCTDGTPELNAVINDDSTGNDIKYTVIVNQKTITLDTTVAYDKVKDTDNIIILYTHKIKIRYVERNHVEQQALVYEIIGDYSTLEGFSLKETSQKLTNDPTLINKEVENFIVNSYKSTLDSQLIASLANSIGSFLLLAAFSCVVLKLPYIFKLKKGFKYRECFKIAITSTLPCIVISILAALLFGISTFASVFGFVFIIRIMFIYFKYIYNNRIYKELYQETKEERFNI